MLHGLICDNLGYENDENYHDKNYLDGQGGLHVDNDNNIYICDGGHYDNSGNASGRLYKLTTSDVTEITGASIHFEVPALATFRQKLISRFSNRDFFICSGGAASGYTTGYIFNVKEKSIDYLVNPSGNASYSGDATTGVSKHRKSSESRAHNEALKRGVISPFGDFIFIDDANYFTAVWQFTEPESLI